MRLIPKDRYITIDPTTNILVLVNVNKFLDRLKQDDPNFYVGPDTKVLSSQERIKKSMKFVTDYVDDSRIFHPKTGERWDKYEIMLEPTEAAIYNNKLGVKNGRHRMVALKNLGYTHAYIEVPRNQKDLFANLV